MLGPMWFETSGNIGIVRGCDSSQVRCESVVIGRPGAHAPARERRRGDGLLTEAIASMRRIFIVNLNPPRPEVPPTPVMQRLAETDGRGAFALIAQHVGQELALLG